MLFGRKIPATVTRASSTPNSTYIQHLPNPPQVPTFTVRKFMGIILNPVKPFYGQDKMFNADVFQLRLIFADWPTGTTEDFPVRPGDHINITSGADNNGNPIIKRYNIAGANFFPTSHLEIYVNVQPLENQS